MARNPRSEHGLLFNFGPLARGMRQALPHVDVFLSGHNVASLEAVGQAL